MFRKYNTDNITILNVFSVSVDENDVGKRSRSMGETTFYQLGIKLKGETDIQYRNKEYVYDDNTVLYLPCEIDRNVPYNKVYRRSGNGVCVFFTSAHQLDTEARLYKLKGTAVANTFKEMLYAFRSDNPLKVKSMFYAALSELDESEKSLRNKSMSEAADYIREHQCDAYVDWRILSKKTGFSADRFRHKFTQEIGMSPQNYLSALKTKAAEELLLNSKLSVCEIACNVGFRDSNYFARFFKTRTGYTPSEFRKKFKQCF